MEQFHNDAWEAGGQYNGLTRKMFQRRFKLELTRQIYNVPLELVTPFGFEFRSDPIPMTTATRHQLTDGKGLRAENRLPLYVSFPEVNDPDVLLTDDDDQYPYADEIRMPNGDSTWVVQSGDFIYCMAFTVEIDVATVLRLA